MVSFMFPITGASWVLSSAGTPEDVCRVIEPSRITTWTNVSVRVNTVFK